jgi:VIT1/CCC1 family predicted Fe2+/Mn2+ transporter
MEDNQEHEHIENHYIHRAGFLRAAVLGANDGIISVSSLIIGIAASGASEKELFTAGVAGLIAGAMSMAAGEYVSVSSQSDTEKADIERERIALKEAPEHELNELAEIYVERGLDSELAMKVAIQLSNHDALGSHVRDELGIVDIHKARPMMAAVSSALAFSLGAFLPLVTLFLLPNEHLIIGELIVIFIVLFFLGGFAAKAGGSGFFRGAVRVSAWGAIAMVLTSLIGSFFNVNL